MASGAFGFEGGVLAVASAAPPIPTLRARLEKNPSFWAVGAALATRVGAALMVVLFAIVAVVGLIKGRDLSDRIKRLDRDRDDALTRIATLQKVVDRLKTQAVDVARGVEKAPEAAAGVAGGTE